jgi:hypothetical protein
VDERHFAGHLHHQHGLQAHAAGVEGEVDELRVLVAVADDERLGVVHVRERGDELGLAAGLEAVVVPPAEARDLVDHLLLLVDLDGNTPR